MVQRGRNKRRIVCVQPGICLRPKIGRTLRKARADERSPFIGAGNFWRLAALACAGSAKSRDRHRVGSDHCTDNTTSKAGDQPAGYDGGEFASRRCDYCAAAALSSRVAASITHFRLAGAGTALGFAKRPPLIKAAPEPGTTACRFPSWSRCSAWSGRWMPATNL